MIRAVAAAALAITGACVMVSVVVLNPELLIRAEETPESIPVKKTGWSPPGDDRIPSGPDGDRIRYGREL
ncbi:MAG: hypothetical protein ACKOAR_07230, partial [Bacteroidota bacterium]